MTDSLAGHGGPSRERPQLAEDAPEAGVGDGEFADASLASQRRPSTDAITAARMSRQARKNTAPEILIRRELHRRGFRYRIEYPLPGMRRRRADIAFTRSQVAVFVDGCFWHACPQHATSPVNNGAWWAEKLRRNVARDRETDAHLEAQGWKVVRVWEHEDPATATDRVAAVVFGTGAGRDRRARDSEVLVAEQSSRREFG